MTILVVVTRIPYFQEALAHPNLIVMYACLYLPLAYIRVISSQEALAHPYLSELHSRADEPVSQTMFDWRYEIDYPDEMPKPLLQVSSVSYTCLLQ